MCTEQDVRDSDDFHPFYKAQPLDFIVSTSTVEEKVETSQGK